MLHPNPIMTVFTHGAGFLPWSLTFPLTHEGFPSTLAGTGRVVTENVGGRSFWGQGGDAYEILMKRRKPKQGRRPELGLCNVAEGGVDYASGAFGGQGDSPPASYLDCGTSHVWERGAQISCLGAPLQSSFSQTVGEYFARAVE